MAQSLLKYPRARFHVKPVPAKTNLQSAAASNREKRINHASVDPVLVEN